jgi:hypothetical protein
VGNWQVQDMLPLLKCVRLLAGILCFTGFILLSHEQFTKYLKRETGTSQSWRKVGKQNFPAFIFCPGKPFKDGKTPSEVKEEFLNGIEELNVTYEGAALTKVKQPVHLNHRLSYYYGKCSKFYLPNEVGAKKYEKFLIPAETEVLLILAQDGEENQLPFSTFMKPPTSVSFSSSVVLEFSTNYNEVLPEMTDCQKWTMTDYYNCQTNVIKEAMNDLECIDFMTNQHLKHNIPECNDSAGFMKSMLKIIAVLDEDYLTGCKKPCSTVEFKFNKLPTGSGRFTFKPTN